MLYEKCGKRNEYVVVVAAAAATRTSKYATWLNKKML